MSNPALLIPNPITIYTSIVVDSDKHQLLYSSQLYGTFFAVSGKFILCEKKENLVSIELHLINYKGLYNIGLLDETKVDFKPISGGTLFELKLHLKALEGVHGHHKHLTIDNLNVPLESISGIDVTRKLHSFVESGPVSDHLNAAYFDAEYYERDGLIIRQKEHLDDATIMNDPDTVAPRVSGMCKITRVMLIK